MATSSMIFFYLSYFYLVDNHAPTSGPTFLIMGMLPWNQGVTPFLYSLYLFTFLHIKSDAEVALNSSCCNVHMDDDPQVKSRVVRSVFSFISSLFIDVYSPWTSEIMTCLEILSHPESLICVSCPFVQL